MGLDNGFRIKNINIQDLPSFANRTRYDENEIIYWRKCWGLRNDVLDVLHGDVDCYYYEVMREDIPAILRRMRLYFDPEYYETNADSIWDYEEFFDNLVNSYLTLSWLYGYMSNHPEIEVEFYDSY